MSAQNGLSQSIGKAKAAGEDIQPLLAEVAARHGATPHEVCLAWLLALDPLVVPIPGATRPGTITASAAAADLALDGDDLAALDGALRRDP